MPTILLFDIDGTLVRTGGAGKAAVEEALRQQFGVTEIRDKVPYSGRTDTAILRDILSVHDIDPTDTAVQQFAEAYLEILPSRLQTVTGQICPGIESLLPQLCQQPHLRLGLLTGNVRRGAMEKLRHYDLWDYFPFGGFGDGHTDRNDVARTALAATKSHLGHDVDSKDIWVIGDTPLDVACARAIGANAVAVATGWTRLEELQATGADLVLEHLGDPDTLPSVWFREQ